MAIRIVLAVAASAALFLSADQAPKTVHAANVIQAENSLPGTTSWQLSKPAKNQEIEGYASTTSAIVGNTVHFYVSTKASSFTASIFRMGWYGGSGGRLVLPMHSMRGTLRRATLVDPRAGLVAAYWPAAFSITVPSTWVSGVYMTKLTASSGFQSYIPFVIRDQRPSTFAFVHAIATDEAYNFWGGRSLYGNIYYTTTEQYSHRAFKVSFDRPFAIGAGSGLFFFFEYPMVRWMEQRGYDVSYLSDLDIQEHYRLMLRHRALVIVGHDEYWSKQMRANYEGAVNHRVSLGVFGGNTGFFAVRFERLRGRRDRIEVCYRDPKIDPLYRVNDSEVTAKWRDPPLNRPESQLLGAMYSGIAGHPYSWVVKTAKSTAFSGTRVSRGNSFPGLVGYEYDKVIANSPVPHNLTILSSSPVVNSVTHASDVSNSTLYAAGSGAHVLNIGSIEWSWGLDNATPTFGWFSSTYPRPHVVNSSVQRITQNLLRILGSS